MHRWWWLLLGGGSFVSCIACSSSKVTPPPGCSTDTATIQAKILGPRCATAGCHSGPTPTGSLDLASPDLEARLVGVAASECQNQTLVVAGDPAKSYLLAKLHDNPACGTRMPSGQPPLSATDIQCLEAWVSNLSAQPSDAGSDGVPPKDSGTTCAAPQTSCGGVCVNLQTDAMNCGKCGNKCAVACSSGMCVATCPMGTTNCGGSCVDTKVDPNNCGTCGKVCGNGQTCVAGACTCGATVSFSSQVQPIFTASCTAAACHGGIMPAQGLDLTAGKSYSLLVGHAASECSNRTRVIPSDVTGSYLWSKLTGTNMCFGSQMPKIGGLSQSQTDTIRAWICSGAKNN